jgi:uncharacterized delta-60 repeat protein
MKACFLLLGLIYFSVTATSQPGTLDSSFGKYGYVVTKIPASLETHFEQSALQKDGKIVAVGWAAIPVGEKIDYHIVVARYNANGTLDPSFGSKGTVVTGFNGKDAFAYCATIQKDGKIVVGGRTQELDGSSSNVALVRYNMDGSLDATFGNKGKLVTSLAQDSQIKKILIQKNGKIVAVGFTQDFLLIRYNIGGTIDRSFGKNGIVLTDFNSGYDIAVSAAVQNDDKIVVAGNVGTTIGLARYRSNGSLDKSFGEKGKVITKLRNDLPQLSDIALQGDRIIVAGTIYKTSTELKDFDFLLARYTAAGALDNTFGNEGIVYTNFGNSSDEAVISVAVQNSEKILVGGGISRYSSRTAGFAFARYNKNGVLDPSFGTAGADGIASSDFKPSPDANYYNYIYAINVNKNKLYCVGLNKLAADNGNLASTQGIVASYVLDNKNLSCTQGKTVASDKGMRSAVVSGINPVLTPSGNNSIIKFSMVGATTANGKGSVSGNVFNIGTTIVTYKLANDPLQSCSFLVIVEDKEAPVISNIVASPATLLPPNSKMQIVTVNYRLKDNFSKVSPSLSVTSNAGSKDDWEIVDAHHVRLRSVRAGQTYTITITAVDKAGNKSSKKINVVVSR